MPEKSGGIVGLGMSMLDLVQVVENFPAESGVTEVSESTLSGGGPVPTALCAAARLGASATIIDRIGDDWRGGLIREDYQKFGVVTDHLISETGRKSSFGNVLVRKEDGERHIVFRAGDFSELSADELPLDLLRSCAFLHLNGRHWSACIEAAKLVRDSGGKVSFDGGAHRFAPRLLELLPLVDILIVARDFAEQLSQSEDRTTQLNQLAQWQAEVVGITDGANGSTFLIKGETLSQPAIPVDPIVDTTGCGDTFHGAFLAARFSGLSWNECIRWATAAASINAGALGGRGFLPTQRDISDLLG